MITQIKLIFENDGKVRVAEHDEKGYYMAIIVDDINLSNLENDDITTIFIEKLVISESASIGYDKYEYPSFLFYNPKDSTLYCDAMNIVAFSLIDKIKAEYPDAKPNIDSLSLVQIHVIEGKAPAIDKQPYLSLKSSDGSTDLCAFYGDLNFGAMFNRRSSGLSIYDYGQTFPNIIDDNSLYPKAQITYCLPCSSVDRLTQVEDKKYIVVTTLDRSVTKAQGITFNQMFYKSTQRANAGLPVVRWYSLLFNANKQAVTNFSYFFPTGISSGFSPDEQLIIARERILTICHLNLQKYSIGKNFGDRIITNHNGGYNVLKPTADSIDYNTNFGVQQYALRLITENKTTNFGGIYNLPISPRLDTEQLYVLGIGNIFMMHAMFHGAKIYHTGTEDVVGKISLAVYGKNNFNTFVAKDPDKKMNPSNRMQDLRDVPSYQIFRSAKEGAFADDSGRFVVQTNNSPYTVTYNNSQFNPQPRFYVTSTMQNIPVYTDGEFDTNLMMSVYDLEKAFYSPSTTRKAYIYFVIARPDTNFRQGTAYQYNVHNNELYSEDVITSSSTIMSTLHYSPSNVNPATLEEIELLGMIYQKPVIFTNRVDSKITPITYFGTSFVLMQGK